jgi:hypothetical protein
VQFQGANGKLKATLRLINYNNAWGRAVSQDGRCSHSHLLRHCSYLKRTSATCTLLTSVHTKPMQSIAHPSSLSCTATAGDAHCFARWIKWPWHTASFCCCCMECHDFGIIDACCQVCCGLGFVLKARTRQGPTQSGVSAADWAFITQG